MVKEISKVLPAILILLILILRLPYPLIRNIGMTLYQISFADNQLIAFIPSDNYVVSHTKSLETIFKLITRLDPDNSSAWQKLGLIKYLDGEEYSAYLIWKSHVKNRDRLSMIASFYASQNDYEKALELFELATTMPGNIGTSNLYFKIGHLNQFSLTPIDLVSATNAYEKALQNDNFYPEEWRRVETYNYLGNIHLESQYFNKAIEYYRLSLLEEPHQYWTLINYARALNEVGNFYSAENELEKAIKLEPNIVDAYLVLARISLSQGEKSRIEDLYEQVLRLDPNSQEANEIIQKLDDE